MGHQKFLCVSLLTISMLASPVSAADKSFPVTSFHTVTVAGPIDVDVHKGKAHSIQASGTPAQLQRLDVKVAGNVLTIGTKKGVGSMDDVKITVITPTLKQAAMTGTGDLEIKGLDTTNITLKVTGSGDIKAKGRCDQATLNVTGRGDIDAEDLICKTVAASVTGSGDIEAHATQSASTKVTGNGEIDIIGGAQCTKSLTGQGRITCL